MVAIFVRVAISHSLTVLSADPEASILPSGANDRELIKDVCPSRVMIFVCVATSHSLTVSSFDPEASILLSGENDTE